MLIHHFFKDKTAVPDSSIRQVLVRVMPQHHVHDKTRMAGAVLGPREFYWAMMDYGSYLKKTIGNLNRASRHYTKQSAFHGSRRQLRGQVIKLLTAGPVTVEGVRNKLTDERLDDVLAVLVKEGMIVKRGKTYRLS